MAERLKRINYSIYLDPLNNPADLYASKVLHQWADDFSRLKAESGEENSLALINARNLQKQVYLSGLFMHLLSPELSQQLSLQVTETQLSAATLERVLGELGLLAKSPETQEELQVQQGMFDALKGAIIGQIQAEANQTRECITAKVKSDEQTELLKRVEEQAQQIAELKTMLAAQTELISQLSSDNVRSPAGQPAKLQQDTPVVDLNERLAHVQKIKKKGIF